MAELASSVITIANVSLVVVEKTVKYIKDIHIVNDLIKDLLVRLKDLHRLIRVVASTYKQAGPSDESSASRFVGKTLTTCQERMEKLKPLVYELAALESETWLQKLTVKRRLDRVKKDIESIIQNIRWDMEYMNTGMNCWSLDVASANRRISEAIATQNANIVRAEIQEMAQEEIDPVRRTLSDAATVFGQDPDLQIRRTSTAISSRSRPSISSMSSQSPPTPSDCSNSSMSIAESVPVNTKSDWEDFHFHISKCGGDQDRIRQIRKILERHSEGSMLAKSTDTWDRTPLHVAAQRGDVELARILVSFGADIDAQDSEPASVLDLALAGRHRNFVAFLLEQQVNESAVLPRNAGKLKDMKRTIQFEKQTARKNSRTSSQSTRSGVVT